MSQPVINILLIEDNQADADDDERVCAGHFQSI